MTEERRKHARSRADFSLRLGPLEGETPATARNLSLSGISCVTDRSFEEMTVLEMRLPLPRPKQPREDSRRGDPEYDVVVCRGAVVRCEPLADEPGRYEIAVFFTDLPPGGRERLQAFLDLEASSGS